MKAKEMVSLLQEFLLSNQPGITTVTTDGTTVTYDRLQALEELAYWQRQAAKEAGKRSPFRSVDLGSAF